MAKEWLTLGEVAQLLGVHPSTVRNWADAGKIPVHRTQGGHRRFRRTEVEIWLQSQDMDGSERQVEQLLQEALKYIRWLVREGELSQQSWFQKLDGEAREAYRQTGHALVHGLWAYLTGKETNLAEAHSLGYEYATRARQFDLSAEEALEAFLFFRNAFLESLLQASEVTGIHSTAAWSLLVRRLISFTDQVLRSLVRTYTALSHS